MPTTDLPAADLPGAAPRRAPVDPRLQAQAASVRRWTRLLTTVFAALLAWRVLGAVRAPAGIDWSGLTFPASMLLLCLAIPRRHRRGAYGGLMAASLVLLGATFALLLRSAQPASPPAAAAPSGTPAHGAPGR